MDKAIASCLGIGYIKGGGTIAAAVFAALTWFYWQQGWAGNGWIYFGAAVAITMLGIYLGNRVEKDWGKDSSRVVIDEAAGMMIAVLFLPHNVYLLLSGFILFRFFDIVKPLYIRKMESLPGGTGVMMDDVLAGIYSNILLQLGVIIFRI